MAASGYVEKKGSAGDRDLISGRMNGLQNGVFDHDFDLDIDNTVRVQNGKKDISECFGRWKYSTNNKVVVGSADLVDLLKGASPLTLCVSSSKESKQNNGVYRQNGRTLRIERSGSTESVAATSGGESCQSSSIASDSASEPSSPSRPVTPLPMPPVPAHLTDHCPYECLRADSEDSGLGPSPAKSSMGPASPLEGGYVSPIQFVPEADDEEDDDDDVMNRVESLLDLTNRRQNVSYIKDGSTDSSFILPYAVANILGTADRFDSKTLNGICHQRGSNASDRRRDRNSSSSGKNSFRFCLSGGESDSPTDSDRSVDSERSSTDIPQDSGQERRNVLDFQFLMNAKSVVEKCPLSDTASELSVESSVAEEVSSSSSSSSSSNSDSKEPPPDAMAIELDATTEQDEVSLYTAADSGPLIALSSSQTVSSSENHAVVYDEARCSPSSCSSETKVADDETEDDSGCAMQPPPPSSPKLLQDIALVPVSDQKSVENFFSSEDTDCNKLSSEVNETISSSSNCVVTVEEVSDYDGACPKSSRAEDVDVTMADFEETSTHSSTCGVGGVVSVVGLCHDLASDCCTSSSSCSQVANDAQSVAADDNTTCKWLNCDAEDAGDSSGDLVDHLRKCHVQSQFGDQSGGEETYVCLWVGCKVFERASSSRSWLERHVLLHGGNKPFRCIVDGCRQRFGTEGALQRHVNSHFPQSNRNGKNGHHGDHAGGNGPNGNSRLLKRKRNHRFRRRPHSVKSNDFFDDGIMEQVRHSLLELSSMEGVDRSGPPAAITFHSTITARRVETSGKVKVLLHWDPEDMLPDCWVPEEEALSCCQKTIPISNLPPDCLVHLDPVYRAKLLPRPGKRRRK